MTSEQLNVSLGEEPRRWTLGPSSDDVVIDNNVEIEICFNRRPCCVVSGVGLKHRILQTLRREKRHGC